MSSRNVPPALAAHLQGAGTTICYLLRITPRQAPAFGITSLDRDVVFDDGFGEMTYYAATGYTPTDQVSSNDLSVDNGEAGGLMGLHPLEGVTIEGINRGDYDAARFVQYLVNYEDLTMGYAIVGFGRVGEVRQTDELACQIELRSLTQVLKQKSILGLTSITCRAKYGDDECKMPLEWTDATVTAVGAESDRTFSIGALPDDFVLPGVVHWVTGANANRELEIEELGDGGEISLTLPTYGTIVVGDTLRISRNCDKSKAMCIAYGNILNMRGEPELPRGDSTGLSTPGTLA